MSRLHAELRRLFDPAPSERTATTAGADDLIDAHGQVRAMALSLGRPADWTAVSSLWQTVQSELSLPAPGIAVSGRDSYQMWFSLDEAVPMAQARAFLHGLQERYLGGIASERISMQPPPLNDTTEAATPAWPAATIPPRLVSEEQWSAFVAPDLAPIFSDTPWLDSPPSLEGQAELLARLQSISPAAWRAAQAQLQPTPIASSSAQSSTQALASAPASSHTGPRGPYQDPKRFLLDVMNDHTVALALRVEAAKALLPHPLADA